MLSGRKKNSWNFHTFRYTPIALIVRGWGPATAKKTATLTAEDTDTDTAHGNRKSNNQLRQLQRIRIQRKRIVLLGHQERKEGFSLVSLAACRDQSTEVSGRGDVCKSRMLAGGFPPWFGGSSLTLARSKKDHYNSSIIGITWHTRRKGYKFGYNILKPSHSWFFVNKFAIFGWMRHFYHRAIKLDFIPYRL